MAKIQDEFNQLKNALLALEADVAKADAGTKAAGTRVRKGLQDIKVKAHNLRSIVLGKSEESTESI